MREGERRLDLLPAITANMSDDRTDSDQSRSKRLKLSSDTSVSNGSSSSAANGVHRTTGRGSESSTTTAAPFLPTTANSPPSFASATNGDSGREVKLNPKMSKLLSTSAKR